MFYSALHAHTENSVKDSPLIMEDYVKTGKELGAKALAITDHGTCTGWIGFMNECKTNGIKPILGVELYVEGTYLSREHLVLLAMNRDGYKRISNIVTKSNKNLISDFPVTKTEILKKYLKDSNGSVVVLSGCVQGVLCSILLANEAIDRDIAKIKRRMNRIGNPCTKEYYEKLDQLDEARVAAGILNQDYSVAKTLADKRYKARMRTVKGLEISDPELFAKESVKLEEEMKESEEAIKNIPILRRQLNNKKKQVTELKNFIAEKDKRKERWDALQNEIDSLEENKLDEEMLYCLALKKAKEYKELLKENFYIELQYHYLDAEKRVMPLLANIATELGIEVVATNDSHFAKKGQEESMAFVRALRYESYKAPSPTDKELYIKTDEELAAALRNCGLEESVITRALSNIRTISDKCTGEYEEGRDYYPKYRDESGEIVKDSAHLLKKMAAAGIKKRFKEGEFTDEYKKRLKYELDVIIGLGYADYLLIVQDFINYGKSLGPFEIGSGRGSGAGSLACYLLGITDIDPMPLGLIFERFLNKDRVSMPDIDTDFSDKVRGKCIEYVRKKYGDECVSSIRTKMTQGAKGAIKNAGRVLGWKTYPVDQEEKDRLRAEDVIEGNRKSKAVAYADSQVEKQRKLAKLGEYVSDTIPEKPPGIKLNDCMEELRSKHIKTAESEIIDMAIPIEGVMTGIGVHAAGVIISDGTPLKDIIPLVYIEDRKKTKAAKKLDKKAEKVMVWATSCDMIEAEQMKMLKMDFLGLTNLDVISDTLSIVKETTGVMPDVRTLVPNDKKVYKDIFATGNTDAVFQFESGGMKDMLKRFKPETFEDIVLLVAAYRPGPMQYLDDIIQTKSSGKHKKTVLTQIPCIQDIISVTYDSIIYQEQVMQIFQIMAGYTLGQADIVRRYMSKKKHDKLAHEREAFLHGDVERGIKGCEANGIDVNLANELFDQMMDFASYAFNKSHAAAYSYVSYITAYLKRYYPREYMCAVLMHTKTKKISYVLNSCRQMGIKVLPPDINKSMVSFTVDNDGNIRYGIGAIKGIAGAADNIIKERIENGPYKSFYDFLIRAHERDNVTTFLIQSGAFLDIPAKGEIVSNRAGLLEVKDICLKYLFDISNKKESIANYIVKRDKCKTAKEKESYNKRILAAENLIKEFEENLEGIEFGSVPEDNIKALQIEKELLGGYLTGHPLDYYEGSFALIEKTDIRSADSDNKTYAGIINNLRITKRKSDGKEMAFFNLEDKTGAMECCVFTAAYERCKEFISDGAVVKVKGNVNIKTDFSDDGEDRETSLQLFVKFMEFVPRKKDSIMLSFNSFSEIGLLKDQFRANFDPSGYRVIIFVRNANDGAGKIVELKETFLRKGVKAKDFPGCIRIDKFLGGKV